MDLFWKKCIVIIEKFNMYIINLKLSFKEIRVEFENFYTVIRLVFDENTDD